MNAPAACLALGGVARTRELRASGVSKRALAQAVAAGSVLRLHRGLYGHPGADLRLLHAARHGGRLACTDALRWRGVWVLPDEGLHIALPRNAHATPHACTEEVVRHWDAGRPTPDRVVPVAAALEQLSRCGSIEQFVVAVESALFGGRVGWTDVGELRPRLGGSPRRVLDFASSRSESGLESLTRWRLFQRGIECRQQVELPLIGRVDLVVGDCLIIELDGREHHSGEVAFALDRSRDAAAAAQGFRTLRFSYAQVIHEWDAVEAAILSVIAAGLHETAAGRRARREPVSERF